MFIQYTKAFDNNVQPEKNIERLENLDLNSEKGYLNNLRCERMTCIQIDNKLIDYNKIEMGIETRICFITY